LTQRPNPLKSKIKPPLLVDIVDLAHDGRGVGRDDGKTVFVHGALPGERVSAQRIGRNRRYDEAICLSVEHASPSRITPACPHFERCGGCALQHLDGEAQRHFKHKRLVDNLTRIGGVSPEQWWDPIVGPEWGYRRRARLSVRHVQAKGRVLVGFREVQGRYVADIDHCMILHPIFGERLLALSELVSGLSIPDAIPQIEVACGDDQGAAMVIRHLKPFNPHDLTQLSAWSSAHGIAIYLQSGGPATIERLAPAAHQLRYALPDFGLQLHFGPEHFIQINAEINQQLVARAVALLSLTGTERVLDLFCGLGNFSLALATQAESVVGVEGAAALVAAAAANAKLNNISNCQFYTSDLNEDYLNHSWAKQAFDAVVIDPPRAGAEAVLPLIAASGARQVVYVSCNPATLARDAAILVNQHGFELVGAGIADMFPHTAHVESIALFRRPA